MNIFQAIYCNQYFELKPKGKANMSRTYGSRLLGISLSMNFILLVVLLQAIWPDITDVFSDWFRDFFGRRRGRFAGKFLAIIPFIIFMPFVHYTIGTPTSYDHLITRFELLKPDRQKAISNKGLYYFICSVCGALIAIVLLLVLA